MMGADTDTGTCQFHPEMYGEDTLVGDILISELKHEGIPMSGCRRHVLVFTWFWACSVKIEDFTKQQGLDPGSRWSMMYSELACPFISSADKIIQI